MKIIVTYSLTFVKTQLMLVWNKLYTLVPPCSWVTSREAKGNTHIMFMEDRYLQDAC